jgi:hypothetical protein
MLSKCFKKGVISKRYAFQLFSRRKQPASMPLGDAKQVVENAELYPSFLVATAESRCKEEIAAKIVPVGKIAEREGWF